LYENHLIFCKQVTEKGVISYQFKFSLTVANLGMSSIIKGEEKKMEIWLSGQPDIYSLEGKTVNAKDDFAAELRKVILKEKENVNNRVARISHSAVYNENMSTTSGSESAKSRRSAFSRSKSLDQEGTKNSHRSRSLDLCQEKSSSEAELVDEDTTSFPKYHVLADYMALTARELNLQEGESVQLIKIGCAGWWYVRLIAYPFSEGWAPSTYLEKLPVRNKTLDRR